MQLLASVFSKSNMFVNNLMQMVDGFLSDSIEANIITIFNVDDEDEIDHSLLDCNNACCFASYDVILLLKPKIFP